MVDFGARRARARALRGGWGSPSEWGQAPKPMERWVTQPLERVQLREGIGKGVPLSDGDPVRYIWYCMAVW